MYALGSEPQSQWDSRILGLKAARSLAPADTALLALGRALRNLDYQFTAVTPATHARVLARKLEKKASLTDIFGWSRPFCRSDIDPAVAQLGRAAEVFQVEGVLFRSCVRFSTLRDQLFVHSGYPTRQANAVFFGPDTYRFCRLIRTAIADMERAGRFTQPVKILDVGAGSGAGGLYAASCVSPRPAHLTLSDINAQALRFCAINAALSGAKGVSIVHSDLFQDVGDGFDLIIANPPYLADKLARAYRHGGGALGSALSERILTEGASRLSSGGRLVLYTGSAIVEGRDQFREFVASWARGRSLHISYEEIDPDVFGEELDQPPYDHADRIAVVSVVIDVLRS
jgi:methylase of polypeptide subunit release factors